MNNCISEELLSDLVRSAIKCGATDAEAIGIESTEFSVEVRLGEVEKLQEASSQGIGLRVLYAGRQASSSTSDISPQALEELVSTAVDMSRLTTVDDAAQLPAKEDLSTEVLDLEIADDAVSELTTEHKIEMAKTCEEAARQYDSRITNSQGAGCSTVNARVTLVSSAGFSGKYRATSCGLMAAPIAGQDGKMQVGYWGDRQRRISTLDKPQDIGAEAARRAVRKLGAGKISTCEVPIVFESNAAEDLLSDFFDAVSGTAIFRRSSFLIGKLGEQIASPDLTIIDDGTIRYGLGSRPFDGEGLASRKNIVVENGVLKTWLMNTYTARKLGLRSTGNASRSLTGAPDVGFSNFYIAPGVYKPDEIISSVKKGFYVTEMIGFGFNPVTGDYSRGAAGIWIEDGKLSYPVEEVTIAANFNDILRGIQMIGNDLRFRGKIAAPTLKVERMMVSGN